MSSVRDKIRSATDKMSVQDQDLVVARTTFLRKGIKEDGGIPGFEVLAVETEIFSDLRESSACFRACHIFVPDEPCNKTLFFRSKNIY